MILADAQAAKNTGKLVAIQIAACDLMPKGFTARGYIVHVGHDQIHFEDECARHQVYAQSIDEIVDIKYA